MTSVVMLDAVQALRLPTVDLSEPLPCSEDPELFWPVAEDGPALLQIAHAKAVCAGCPQRAPCLQHALAAAEPGIWGGTTEQEREDMLRRCHGTTPLGRSA